jgi:hypothetical protein
MSIIYLLFHLVTGIPAVYIGMTQMVNPTFPRSPKSSTPLASLQIDHLELCIGRKLRSNVYEATTPHFDLPIVVKFAQLPFEIPYLNSETSAYQ